MLRNQCDYDGLDIGKNERDKKRISEVRQKKFFCENPRDSSRIRYEYFSKIIREEGSCVKLL